jgi:calcineurin-like phosphoesterase family protein
MSKVFITSDSHLGHSNILKYCARDSFLADYDKEELNRQGGKWHDGDWKGPRSSKWRISQESVEEMDDAIINNINKMVGKNDTLYHLGDFCFAAKHNYYKVAANYRRRINCDKIVLIWGNHDHRVISDLFSSCHDLYDVTINNKRVILCHYAMATFNGSHRGTLHCYGHSHSNLESWMDKVMPGRRSMDVGIDNAYKLVGEYRPFAFEEIEKILGNKPGFSSDHHGIRSGPTEEDLADK